VGHHDARVHAGAWSRAKDFSFWDFPQVELAGLTMGIVGFGRIGRRVGELAHAFGMRVLAHNRSAGAEPEYQPFARVDRATLFREADVVSLHTPQTAENLRMVNAELLATMKPTAMLINTARGLLIDEGARAEALNGGWLAGAAVDVASAEPIDPANPLLGAKHCVITPHIAWSTLAARRRLMEITAGNIRAYLAGAPMNVVNGG
jgi:glycerate dehydrogenase